MDGLVSGLSTLQAVCVSSAWCPCWKTCGAKIMNNGGAIERCIAVDELVARKSAEDPPKKVYAEDVILERFRVEGSIEMTGPWWNALRGLSSDDPIEGAVASAWTRHIGSKFSMSALVG